MRSSTIPYSRPEIRPIQPLLHGAALAALYETESIPPTNKSQHNLSANTARVNAIDQLKASGDHGFISQTAQGQVIGAITLFNNPYQPGTVIVANLVTDQRVRRKGVGRSLLQHAISFTKKHAADFLALQVDHDNVPAIRLYESFGFERMGEVQELSLPASKRRRS
jgi:ribosomal protein S18 acetylase RimI-like enzyme